jgi:hypothetical protein
MLRRRVGLFGLALGVALIGIAAAAAGEGTVAGTWRITLDPDFSGKRVEDAGACAFKQQGATLSGDCAGGAIKGQVEDNRVTFTVQTGSNGELATFTGVLEHDTFIGGMWRLTDRSGDRSGGFYLRKR